MPITTVHKEELGRSLVLPLDNGIDEKGKQLSVSKTFSSIREAAADADVLNSANVLASLQDRSLMEVIVQQRSVLLG